MKKYWRDGDQDYVNQSRRPRWFQIILQSVLPAIITALLIWGAGKIAGIDKTLALVAYDITDIKKDLKEHRETTTEALNKNSELHHSLQMRVPCTGCHIMRNGALKAR